MAAPYIYTRRNSSVDDRRLENEAFWEAIQKCDDDTYEAVISVLTEAGLLHA